MSSASSRVWFLNRGETFICFAPSSVYAFHARLLHAFPVGHHRLVVLHRSRAGEFAAGDAPFLLEVPVEGAAEGDGGERDQAGEQGLEVGVGDALAAEVAEADRGVGQ